MKLSNRYKHIHCDCSRQRGSLGRSIVVAVAVAVNYSYFKIFYIIILYDTTVITIGCMYMFRALAVNKADRASVMG